MPPLFVPEEVDVFSVPHSRMKELVNNYFDMIQSTNFTNIIDLQQLLESLSCTFREFKSHEQIENKFIMKRLKLKMKKQSIKNSAVCNCHKDNAVGDMMMLLADGYKKKTEQDCLNYGLQLKQALENFTENFLPHMKEEEEVFQPLLLQFFSYEELCELKLKVIQQHFEQELQKSAWMRWVDLNGFHDSTTSNSSDSEAEDTQTKHLLACSENVEHQQTTSKPRITINSLPPEVLMKIFQFLGPQDLCQCVQVTSQWGKLAMDSTLWKLILPAVWAKGDWSFHSSQDEDEDEQACRQTEDDDDVTLDDDADIDETVNSDYNQMICQVKNEVRILSGLTDFVLPRVGANVQKLVLANCRTLTNGLLQKLLTLCPNIEHLDVSHTRITDAGLRRLGKNGCGSKLKTLNLSGCVKITDATLVRVAVALSEVSSIHANSPDNSCCVESAAKQHDVTDADSHNAHGRADSSCDAGKLPSTEVKLGAKETEKTCSEKAVQPETQCEEFCDQVDNHKDGTVMKSSINQNQKGHHVTQTVRTNNTSCPMRKIQKKTDNFTNCPANDEGQNMSKDVTFKSCRKKRSNVLHEKSHELSNATGCSTSLTMQETKLLEDVEESREEPCKTEQIGVCSSPVNSAVMELHEADPRCRNETSAREVPIKCCKKTDSDMMLNDCLDRTLQKIIASKTEEPCCCRNRNHPELKSESYYDNHTSSNIGTFCKSPQPLQTDEMSLDSPIHNHVNNQLDRSTDDLQGGSFDPGRLGRSLPCHPSCVLRKPVDLDCLEECTPKKSPSNASKSRSQSTPDNRLCCKNKQFESTQGASVRLVHSRMCHRMKSTHQKSLRLECLNLSGCYQITDRGLRSLASIGLFSCLRSLDLSGCFQLSASGLEAMVSVCPVLNKADFCYCDNIVDGPFADVASGCRNLQCSSRVCCRSGD